MKWLREFMFLKKKKASLKINGAEGQPVERLTQWDVELSGFPVPSSGSVVISRTFKWLCGNIPYLQVALW
jgi:hypothetical protein